MSEWIGYIGALGLGAVLADIVRGVINWFMHKRQLSDEIKKSVILKKLQVSEDAMACLQSVIDELMQLKWICQVEKDIPTNYLEWGRNLEEHLKILYPEVQSKLNRLCTYYDFSSLEIQYDIYHKMEEFNKDVAELSLYCQNVHESEMTGGHATRVIVGDAIKMKEPIMKRLGESVQVVIDYAEDMQKLVRKEVCEYCR